MEILEGDGEGDVPKEMLFPLRVAGRPEEMEDIGEPVGLGTGFPDKLSSCSVMTAA